MSEYFLGEIRAFPWDFAPRGWALCNGALLSVSTNQALFSLLGVTYGGNGSTTFGLPDLRGRTIVGVGQYPGGNNYTLGAAFGTESVTLTADQLPAHNHGVTATAANGNVAALPNNFLSVAQTAVTGGTAVQTFTQTNTNPVVLPPDSVLPSGGGQPHPNVQPYTTINYCIALAGIFPSRP